MDRVERRLDATLKIVQTGMRMLVRMEKEHREFEKENREFRKETREAIHALIDAQMRTDGVVRELTGTVQTLSVKFDRFIDSLGGRNGSNGRGRRPKSGPTPT